ncbi:MAG: flagellar biosynthesis protein FlhF [Bacteroidetes bacterium]|nr:flagellar biosynthesis protein FlhF [Bacteroidota bacterium]
MQVKKYIAPTLKSATEQMKNEMGDEALILSTRVIRESGYPGQKMFELTAGIEDVVTYHETSNHTEAKKEEIYKSFEEELQKISNKVFKNSTEIEDQIGVRKLREKTDAEIETPQSFKSIVEKTIKKLEEEEIEKLIIKKIILQLKKYGKIIYTSNLDNHIISSIASMIPTKEFNVSKGLNPKVVSLVGPTGVGKTTCIAKLAIISKILHNLDVGLISIDTYRIGALDQLKVFSDVSNIDMLVAYEPKDLNEIMKQFSSKDVVFIDTAGRSQKNDEFLTKAKEFLTNANVDETYLVMSATSSTKTLLDIADKFTIFNYDSVIFSKIDEGVAFGNLLNLITKINVPSIFLTNGQVIPDDIISADAGYMAKLIYTGKVL